MSAEDLSNGAAAAQQQEQQQLLEDAGIPQIPGGTGAEGGGPHGGASGTQEGGPSQGVSAAGYADPTSYQQQQQQQQGGVGGHGGMTEEERTARKIFVGGLNRNSTAFGPVHHTEVLFDKLTGRSRGFGFVTFEQVETINNVVDRHHTIDESQGGPLLPNTQAAAAAAAAAAASREAARRQKQQRGTQRPRAFVYVPQPLRAAKRVQQAANACNSQQKHVLVFCLGFHSLWRPSRIAPHALSPSPTNGFTRRQPTAAAATTTTAAAAAAVSLAAAQELYLKQRPRSSNSVFWSNEIQLGSSSSSQTKTAAAATHRQHYSS
ncbi:hypothetical protein ACSSS7_007776 [Eimeria intestinalis]